MASLGRIMTETDVANRFFEAGYYFGSDFFEFNE